MHKVFISFHHADLEYKDALVSFNQTNQIFIDRSVDTGEISDALSDQEIREKIRDEHIRGQVLHMPHLPYSKACCSV